MYYYIQSNLSVYCASTLTGRWEFPDFSDECPICGGKECAVRHGFYGRWGYSLKDRKLLYIPVPRYLCRKKGKSPPKSRHRTFSLLPSSLIPYHLYDVDCLVHIVRGIYQKQQTMLQAAMSLMERLSGDHTALEAAHAFRSLNVFRPACLKMNLCLQDSRFLKPAYVLEYLCGLKDLSRYMFQFYERFKIFLFGNSSQNR